MQEIWTKVYDLLHETFPDRPIINAFGNNDFTIDYEPPLHKEHKDAIYGFLATLWFKNHKHEDKVKILPNFMEGGFYV